ncbi:MAG TPA: redoxin domain-containing protein [Dehalococcoidia bacterium]|nr:redoxin domain-containing protein [Dehalococcoidia bacterium]
MPARRRPSKRKKPPPPFGSGVVKFFKRNARNFAVTALALAIIAGAWIIIDPYAAPTALDANGQQVTLGPINDNPDARPRSGSPAPNFVLADYDGNAVRLEDFRGKVVFLNFWATWCTACEAEMPAMNILAEQHPDDLVVLAVNRGEGKGKAKKWSDARDLDSIFFAVDPRESISGAYRLPNSMPVSFFVDANGRITRVVPSAQSLSVMEQAYQEAKLSSGLGMTPSR